MRYDLRFSEEARAHLRQLSARERRIVLDAALAALAQEPEKETRNLKILRPNPIAKYELRVGNLRLFFEVDGVAREVMMLAIGRKDGNRLWIGGREVEL